MRKRLGFSAALLVVLLGSCSGGSKSDASRELSAEEQEVARQTGEVVNEAVKSMTMDDKNCVGEQVVRAFGLDGAKRVLELSAARTGSIGRLDAEALADVVNRCFTFTKMVVRNAQSSLKLTEEEVDKCAALMTEDYARRLFIGDITNQPDEQASLAAITEMLRVLSHCKNN